MRGKKVVGDYHGKEEKTEEAETGERSKLWEWWMFLITCSAVWEQAPAGSPKLIVVFF